MFALLEERELLPQEEILGDQRCAGGYDQSRALLLGCGTGFSGTPRDDDERGRSRSNHPCHGTECGSRRAASGTGPAGRLPVALRRRFRRERSAPSPEAIAGCPHASRGAPHPIETKVVENRPFLSHTGICLGRRGSAVRILSPRPMILSAQEQAYLVYNRHITYNRGNFFPLGWNRSSRSAAVGDAHHLGRTGSHNFWGYRNWWFVP